MTAETAKVCNLFTGRTPVVARESTATGLRTAPRFQAGVDKSFTRVRIADGGDGAGDGLVGHGLHHELIDILPERGCVVRRDLRPGGLERVERWPKDGVTDRAGGLSQGDTGANVPALRETARENSTA